MYCSQRVSLPQPTHMRGLPSVSVRCLSRVYRLLCCCFSLVCLSLPRLPPPTSLSLSLSISALLCTALPSPLLRLYLRCPPSERRFVLVHSCCVPVREVCRMAPPHCTCCMVASPCDSFGLSYAVIAAVAQSSILSLVVSICTCANLCPWESLPLSLSLSRSFVHR